ncbi:MAG: DUF4402 domain-containing protein [Chromatiales bacterium]|nr:DUF4402 domain-containing protein [Chromatiales bacterium]
MKTMNAKSPIQFLKRVTIALSVISSAIVLFAWSSPQAATAIARVTADVIETISITARSDLSFGNIPTMPTGGTVTISPTGTQTFTGATDLSSALDGSPASFEVTGTPNSSYSIRLPISSVLNNSTTTSMVVHSFTSLPEQNGLLDNSGRQMLYIGATLNISPNQPIGAYVIPVAVTVDYN